ncbi:hypothetical protein PsorP6_004599 [Peronosclerospora sorghi]|uniref:Uncharacterized protein n=1 Tax=Peronosclerospora sorghi TaxID=230839 RepID=A0ACC0VSL1_9STRA|nr:hypothetical protein PsorP6_004599 [Peronosclerospora sorghi]
MAPTIKDDELPERRRRGDDDIAVLSSGHQEVLPPDKIAKRSPASIIVEEIRDFRITSDLKSMYQKNDGPSKRRETSSPIWYYGVTLKKKNETDKRLFFCMASSTCRNPSRTTRIMYTRDETTAAVNHLRDFHGIVGGKSVAVAKKKADIDAADKESKIFNLYKKNPRSSVIPVIHLNLDLWTSKVSKEKYVGVRIYFIDIYWGLNSYILAINPFAPSSDVIKGNRFSEILQMWLRDILAEFGIRITDIAGSTSDGGSDVQRGMTSLDDSKLLE